MDVDTAALFAQILICFVDPILTRRGEGVDADTVFEGLGGVRRVRRNEEKFPRTQNEFFAIH